MLDKTLVGAVGELIPNVARNGFATQSSDYHHTTRFDDPDYAFYATDGDFSTELSRDARCAITLDNLGGNWWQVDLLTPYLIVKVAVTTRHTFGGYYFLWDFFKRFKLLFHLILVKLHCHFSSCLFPTQNK